MAPEKNRTSKFKLFKRTLFVGESNNSGLSEEVVGEYGDIPRLPRINRRRRPPPPPPQVHSLFFFFFYLSQSILLLILIFPLSSAGEDDQNSSSITSSSSSTSTTLNTGSSGDVCRRVDDPLLLLQFAAHHQLVYESKVCLGSVFLLSSMIVLSSKLNQTQMTFASQFRLWILSSFRHSFSLHRRSVPSFC